MQPDVFIRWPRMNVIDEYTHECLAVRVARRLDHEDVHACLVELFCARGVPVHLRADEGPDFHAKLLRGGLDTRQGKPLWIEPGSPWENGYMESFNGKLRDYLLKREIFYTLQEAKILPAACRRHR